MRITMFWIRCLLGAIALAVLTGPDTPPDVVRFFIAAVVIAAAASAGYGLAVEK